MSQIRQIQNYDRGIRFLIFLRGDILRKSSILHIAALALVLCLILCSCGGSKSSSDDELPILTIGSDIYEPYFYVDVQYVGIDIDIATEACKRLGYKAVFKQIKWQTKDSYLESGEVDCLWGSFTMNGREDRYTWAGPYMSSRQIVLVAEDSGIYTLDDLNGKTLAVQNSSKPEELFLDGELSDKIHLKNLYAFPSMANVISAMKDGYVDACAGHENAYRSYMKKWNGKFRILDEPLFRANLGVAFLKGTHEDFAQRLTDVLFEMKQDGTIASILSAYNIDAEAALSEELQ